MVVAAVLGLVLVLTGMYRQRAHRLRRAIPGQRVPSELVSPGASRTWVLFTAPFCATCGPAEQALREAHPEEPVVVVDAAARPELARRLAVAAAPTLLAVDRRGEVRWRATGPDAVLGSGHAASRQPPSSRWIGPSIDST